MEKLVITFEDGKTFPEIEEVENHFKIGGIETIGFSFSWEDVAKMESVSYSNDTELDQAFEGEGIVEILTEFNLIRNPMAETNIEARYLSGMAHNVYNELSNYSYKGYKPSKKDLLVKIEKMQKALDRLYAESLIELEDPMSPTKVEHEEIVEEEIEEIE